MRGTATHARNCALPEEMIHDLEPADGGLDEEEDIGGTEGEQLGIALRHSVGVRHQLHCTHTQNKNHHQPPISINNSDKDKQLQQQCPPPTELNIYLVWRQLISCKKKTATTTKKNISGKSKTGSRLCGFLKMVSV